MEPEASWPRRNGPHEARGGFPARVGSTNGAGMLNLTGAMQPFRCRSSAPADRME